MQLLFSGIWLTVLPAFADIISIEPPSSTVLPGQAFSINVDVSGISDLYAFQFDIGFNPAVISATSITEGSFLPAVAGRFSFLERLTMLAARSPSLPTLFWVHYRA